MNQRQKIIAVAVAIPVVALIAYAATSGNERGNRAQPPKQMQNKVAPKPGNANKNTPGKAGKKVTLADMKERSQKILDKANAVTPEEYEKMRALRPSLPETLDEYKADVKESSDKVLNMTEEEYAASMAARAMKSKRNGGPKGGPKGAPKGGPKGSFFGGPKGGAKGEPKGGATPPTDATATGNKAASDGKDELTLPVEGEGQDAE